LLFTGGSDISPEFLRQEVADPSVLSKDMDPQRDRWEFQAVQQALSRGLPILAICKGLQLFNVALGGTLKLDIKGHNLPEQKHSAAQVTLLTAFQKLAAPIIRRLIGSGTIWTWRLGRCMMASSSKFACANSRSASRCNIIRSEAGLTSHSSTIFLREWNRRNTRAQAIAVPRILHFPSRLAPQLSGAVTRAAPLRPRTHPAA